jgi:response regulator RpfG family c-di-GMP phosphodiesterase
MAKFGPIILVDDDTDDTELVSNALTEIGIRNKIIHFDNCDNAFQFLKTTTESPFIILSDVNLPARNGIEFKRRIDEDSQLRSKSIPFVFFSTSVDKKSVDTAYKELTVQGFFQKSNSYQDLKNVMKLIMDYWSVCRHPNS